MQTASITYRNLPTDSASFEIFGADVEPTHWAWSVASAGDRRLFWVRFAVLAGTAWDAQIASGIGADGSPLMPVRRRGTLPRPGTAASRKWDGKLKGRFKADEARQDGPPLTPHRLASRARRWARAKPLADRVRFYWVGSHKGKKWGAIMAWHSLGMAGTGKKGQVTGRVRDIVGIADKFLEPAVARARKEWAAAAGAKYEAMARTMATRLATLREEFADLTDLLPTAEPTRWEAMYARLNVLGQLIARIELDPILTAFRNSAGSAPGPDAGDWRWTKDNPTRMVRRIRPVAPLPAGQTRVLRRRSTVDQLRGG
jgi:hypothetical protein